MSKNLNIKNLRFISLAVLIAILSPSVAQAHTGASATSGVLAGFLHPFTGLDHILAMVGVGLIAVMLGKKNIWALPLTFVASLFVGSLVGQLGLQVGFVEEGILVSNILLGLLLLTNIKLPKVVLYTVIGVFAIFHGFAHGAEIPASVSALNYSLGFVSSTIALHGLGIVSGYIADKYSKLLNNNFYRFSGVGVLTLTLLLIIS